MITLTGEPKSTNHLYKSTCQGGYPKIYMTDAGRTLKEDYQWQVRSQWKEGMILENVGLYMKIFFGTRKKQDIDNFFKIVLDAMTGLVWGDDSQIEFLTIRKAYDKEQPRIEVKVLPINDTTMFQE